MKCRRNVIGVYLLFAVLLAGGCGGERPAAPAVVREQSLGEAALRLTLARDTITIAENAVVTLTVEYPENWKADWTTLPGDGAVMTPETADTAASAPAADAPVFTLLRKEISRPRLTEKNAAAPSAGASGSGADAVQTPPPSALLAQTAVLHLEPFLAGDYSIPALTVTLYDAANRAVLLHSEPLTVKVLPVIKDGVDTAELRDITAVRAAPLSWRRLALYGSGVALAILAGIILYRRWQRQRALAALPVPLTPEEFALAALTALESADYPGRGLYSEFYVELSAILRRYLEQRYCLAAPEQTTEEFLHGLQNSALPAATALASPERQKLLADFLRACDLVKFAKFAPAAAEAEAALAVCREFITCGESAAAEESSC